MLRTNGGGTLGELGAGVCLPVATYAGEKETLFSAPAVYRSMGFEMFVSEDVLPTGTTFCKIL